MKCCTEALCLQVSRFKDEYNWQPLPMPTLVSAVVTICKGLATQAVIKQFNSLMLHLQLGSINELFLYIHKYKCAIWTLLAMEDEGKLINYITTVCSFLHAKDLTKKYSNLQWLMV
jgi:hypothetical protein